MPSFNHCLAVQVNPIALSRFPFMDSRCQALSALSA
jgi:hypothetical protein